MIETFLSSARPAALQSQRILQTLWRAMLPECRAYRPERHYMRGPGPKWREKHLVFGNRRSQ
jgi:hypothetical protein